MRVTIGVLKKLTSGIVNALFRIYLSLYSGLFKVFLIAARRRNGRIPSIRELL